MTAALAANGAEVVEADMNKPESLTAAVSGSYGVLGLTDCTLCVTVAQVSDISNRPNFTVWALLPTVGFNTAKAQKAEEEQGRNLIEAAKTANVKHFVFLSLPPGDCPHFQYVSD